MTKIFIDTNIYLDFYRLNSVRAMLPPLENLSEHILSTEQVVNEVLRNRVSVTRDFLREDLKKCQLVKPSIPDFLTKEAVSEICPEIAKISKECSETFKTFEELSKTIYSKSVEHVANGDDEISKTLARIFTNVLVPDVEQLRRARIRKELGNPPGKKEDPIGDEITWEQLLTYRTKNKCEIWIVSKDEDFYSINISGAIVPNAYLLNEVNDSGPSIKFFRDLPTALKEFKKSILPDLELPTEEEMEKAEQAQTTHNVHPCLHEATLVRNGRFDIWVCNKCHKQLGAFLADFDD